MVSIEVLREILQPCCQIAERSDHSKDEYSCLEFSRDLAVTRLMAQWIKYIPNVSKLITLIHIEFLINIRYHQIWGWSQNVTKRPKLAIAPNGKVFFSSREKGTCLICRNIQNTDKHTIAVWEHRHMIIDGLGKSIMQNKKKADFNFQDVERNLMYMVFHDGILLIEHIEVWTKWTRMSEIY